MLTLFYTFFGFGDSCFACDGSSTIQLFNIVNGNLVFLSNSLPNYCHTVLAL
jgi:hypothetical protein